MKVAFTQVLFTQVVQVLRLNYCHVCPTFNLIPFFSVLKVVQKNSKKSAEVYNIHFFSSLQSITCQILKRYGEEMNICIT